MFDNLTERDAEAVEMLRAYLRSVDIEPTPCLIETHLKRGRLIGAAYSIAVTDGYGDGATAGTMPVYHIMPDESVYEACMCLCRSSHIMRVWNLSLPDEQPEIDWCSFQWGTPEQRPWQYKAKQLLGNTDEKCD